MKIDVKEKLVKVDIATKHLFLKNIEKENVVSVTHPCQDIWDIKDRFAYRSTYENYEFTLYDEEIGYIDFKIRPHMDYQDVDARELIRTLLSLHKN